jgi:hypothetical protein
MFTGVVNLDSVLEDQNRNRDGRVVGILPSRMDAQSLGKKSSTIGVCIGDCYMWMRGGLP